MLSIKNVILGAVVASIVGAIAGWWITDDILTSKHEAQIQRMRLDAAEALRVATDRAIQAEREGISLALKLEVQNAETRKRLDGVLADNRRLSRELGGLRDPFAIASGGCSLPSASPGSGITIATPAPGRLSDEASEFLLEFAREADRAAEYANTCHRWIEEVNGRR
jgi:hypothetical protein